MSIRRCQRPGGVRYAVCAGAGRRAIRGVCHEYRVSPPALDMRVAWFAVLVAGIGRWLDVML